MAKQTSGFNINVKYRVVHVINMKSLVHVEGAVEKTDSDSVKTKKARPSMNFGRFPL